MNPPDMQTMPAARVNFAGEVAASLRGDGCHEHGHGEVEATNERVIQRGRTGEDIVVDVGGKEDTERLHRAMV